ncbi:MAG TPA: thioredoxin [Paludibacteraceae bacterium]|nr:thioredoxin [Paludibacteraceae bacterium]HOK36445.1 thioredoxin [Paludibacteraceae bacterium]HOL01003.1 thioredoxin [Paludibacteraceae bacterium]HPC25955.1 thioredoxin [Paludibacteraceae bacterium]HPO67692.1 thioredoxin [Paludibacteraceae bacterium]
MALEFTDENIKEIINNGKPVVIDFWAEWCGPCRMMSPIIEELAHEYEGKVEIGKLNVDENSETTEEYGIMNIPTLLFFKNGQIVDKQVGATQKSVLVKKIEALLS